jgi:GMP synthase (glutamine-hydrolysing)
LRPLLDRAGAGEASVVGICFGAQLLAHLLAGPTAVRPHRGGMQAGLVEVSCGDGATHSPESGGGPARQVVSSFHYQCVDRAALERAGAEILLSSSATPVQAFRFGGNVTGLQFHPELTPGMLRLTLRTHRTLVDATGTGWRRADRSIDARSHRWSGTLWNALVLGTLVRALSTASPGDAAAPTPAPAPALVRVPA